MPSIYDGRGAAIGIAEEVTWGTPVSPPTNWLPLLPGASLARQVPKSLRNHLRVSGSSAIRRSHIREADNVGGGFSFEANYQTNGIILKHLLGAVSTTGAGPFVHTYDPADDPSGGLTLVLHRGDDDEEIFEGCKLNAATFSCSFGGVLTVSIDDVIGETSTARATPTETQTFGTDVETGIVEHHHGADLSYGGGSFCIQDFSLTYNNALARRGCLWLLLTREPKRGDFTDVTASVTVEVDDDLYADLTGDTQSDVVITFTSGTNIYKFTVHNAFVSTVSDPVSGPGILTQTVEFVGTQGGAAKLGFEVEVTNDEASGISNG